jgi:hypothetical protein
VSKEILEKHKKWLNNEDGGEWEDICPECQESEVEHDG